MSVYNGEKYVNQAIDSILNQTFEDFEFLIINDGSTDRTPQILRSYKDSRIRLYNNLENKGLTKSLNIVLRIAKGEYIARQDADDVSMPERLEKELYFLEAHKDYAVVGTFVKIMNEKSKIIRFLERPVKDTKIRRFLKINNCITHGSAIIRMESLLDVGFYDELMERSQDYELWLRISKKYRLANIPEFLYIWREHCRNIGVKFMREQQIFVVLAKIKNNFIDIEEASNQFINAITKYNFISSRLNPLFSIFRLINLITIKRINAYNVYRIFYKLRFNNVIKKTMIDFKLRRINFDNTVSNLKKIVNRSLVNCFL